MELKPGERIDDLQLDGLYILQKKDGFRFSAPTQGEILWQCLPAGRTTAGAKRKVPTAAI